MKYCSHCGTRVEDGVKFCPACGSRFEMTQASEVVELACAQKKEPSWQRVASRIILKVSKIVAIVGLVYIGIIISVCIFAVFLALSEIFSGVTIGYAGLFALMVLEFILLLPIFILILAFIGKTIKLIDAGKKIPKWLKICVLIFVNVVPGIFLLTDSEDGYDD